MKKSDKKRRFIEKLCVDKRIQVPNWNSVDETYQFVYTKLNIRPWHLSSGSEIKIRLKCPECSKIREINFYKCMKDNFTGLCSSCSRIAYHKEKGHFIKSEHTPQEIEEHLLKNHWYTSSTWLNKRIKILERDNYTCKKCGSKEHLHVHHIYPRRIFKSLELVDDNLITLCGSCHQSYHAVYNIYPPHEFNKWLGG